MKTCPTCKAIHPDDYAGQCPHCGAPLGAVRALGIGLQGDIGRAARESASMERRLLGQQTRGGGTYDASVRLRDSLLETARSFVIAKEPPADGV